MPFKTRITDARHNAETGCFEAHVTLMEGTESFTYSVECPAPIDSDTDEVQAALVARARRRHRPAECRLVRRRVATPPAGPAGGYLPPHPRRPAQLPRADPHAALSYICRTTRPRACVCRWRAGP
ncbi:hypothetical protein ACSQ8I_09355 [Marinovum sp. E06]|uniref:hypothetical protein n=1 Tax=Marinovum sp. E06 TaxID=3449225 RepID=UPI003EDC7054